MEDGILCDSSLPTAEIDVTVKLARIWRSHNNSLAGMAYNGIVARISVSMQSDHQLKVSLLWVWPPLLPHVVASRLGEVESAHGHFAHLPVREVDPRPEIEGFSWFLLQLKEMLNYLQHWEERLFGAIRLWLFHTNCLSGRLELHAIEVKVKRANFLHARGRFHKRAVAVQLDVSCDLEVILLLTHECVVGVGKIKAFVGIHAKMRNCSGRNFCLNFV